MVDDLTKSNMKSLNNNGNYNETRMQTVRLVGKQINRNIRTGIRRVGKASSVIGNKIMQKTRTGYKPVMKAAETISKAFMQNKLSKDEILMRRKVMAQRLQALQAQRKGVISQGREDNKFNRRIMELQMRDDEDERKRRFIEVPDDFEQRKDDLRQLKIRRAREFVKRNNILRSHEGMIKVKLDLLRVDDTCNLMKAPRIWTPENPDNNIFADRGRPTIMDTPNVFRQTDETRRFNILNTPHLNFGKVDLTRKPRRFNFDEKEYSC